MEQQSAEFGNDSRPPNISVSGLLNISSPYLDSVRTLSGREKNITSPDDLTTRWGRRRWAYFHWPLCPLTPFPAQDTPPYLQDSTSTWSTESASTTPPPWEGGELAGLTANLPAVDDMEAQGYFVRHGVFPNFTLATHPPSYSCSNVCPGCTNYDEKLGPQNFIDVNKASFRTDVVAPPGYETTELEMVASLVYEGDHAPVPGDDGQPPLSEAKRLSGKMQPVPHMGFPVRGGVGRVELKLHKDAVSSKHKGRKFRIKVVPADERLRADPSLSLVSLPFTSKTKTMRSPDWRSKTGGKAFTWPAQHTAH
jgi:hypothetical protein